MQSAVLKRVTADRATPAPTWTREADGAGLMMATALDSHRRAQLLELSLLGVGAVLRLERDAW